MVGSCLPTSRQKTRSMMMMMSEETTLTLKAATHRTHRCHPYSSSMTSLRHQHVVSAAASKWTLLGMMLMVLLVGLPGDQTTGMVQAKKPKSPLAATTRTASSTTADSRRRSSSSGSAPSKKAPITGRSTSSISRRPAPLDDEEEAEDPNDDDEGVDDEEDVPERPVKARPRVVKKVDADLEDDEEENDRSTLVTEDDDVDEEDEDLRRRPPRRRPVPGVTSKRRPVTSERRPEPVRKRPPPRPRQFADEEEMDGEDGDDEEEQLPKSRAPPGGKRADPWRPRPNQRRPRGRAVPGRIVPYQTPSTLETATATFTKGLEALRSTLPDPSTVRDAALSSINTVRETTSSLSANLYREVKGLTSSELEQVMLKATKPDDSPVKGKHVERLVGVTYQISSRYDIYDAVLRKLWAKMAEKDWRTTIKALYILHRFAADGAPEHAAALKARLRELRRTRDPKRKEKYFNSKQLLAGDARPDNAKFRAFMARYAHYVLLRAQCFSGIFDEISGVPKMDKKKPAKPITATALRQENMDAAVMLLKAGLACQLKEGEECENTAIAAERVASDLIGLSTAVAMALNRALKDDDLKGADPVLLKKWCVLYKDELLPQTRAMVKKTASKLDAYGLFLPSRMGTTVSPEILEKGLNLADSASSSSESTSPEDAKEQEDAEDEAESTGENKAEQTVAARKAEATKPSESKEVEKEDVTAVEPKAKTRTSPTRQSVAAEEGNDKEEEEDDEDDEEEEDEEEDGEEEDDDEEDEEDD